MGGQSSPPPFRAFRPIQSALFLASGTSLPTSRAPLAAPLPQPHIFALTVVVVLALAIGALAHVALSPRLEDNAVPLTELAGARVEYLQDFTGSATLAEVTAGSAARRFQPLAEAASDPALRRLPGPRVNWFRLTIPNPDAESRTIVLQFADRALEEAQLYRLPAEPLAVPVESQARVGLRVPLAQRSVRSHLPAIGVTLPPRQSSLYLVRNAGELDAPGPVMFWRSPEDFRRHEQRELVALAIYVGLAGVLLLYHGISAAVLRDRAMPLFSGYLAATVALVLFATNATVSFLEGPAGITRIATIVGLAALAGLARVQFGRALLETSQTARSWDTVLRTTAWILLASAVAAPALLIVPETVPLATRVVPVVVLFTILVMPLVALYAGVYGARAAPLAAIAFGCLFASVGWVVLSRFGWVATTPTGLAPIFIGSALEFVLLGGALLMRQRGRQADRDEWYASHATRREREAADAKGDLLGLAHQLAQSKQDKDRLIELIAQEIRAPLASLLAVSRSLPSERAAEQLPVIRRRCSALIELLNTVIDWARLRTGQFAHDPARCHLATLADTALRPLEASALDKGVRLDRRVPPTLSVRADETGLGCVLRNLVGNALKFTPTGGMITIDASLANSVVEMRIQDTGAGMTAEQLARLHSPSSSAIPATPGTAGETGAGLGLAVARELLERDGGTLRFESTLGRGTVAIVTLPAEAAANVAPAPSPRTLTPAVALR